MEEITKEDLQDLIENPVPEKKTKEYKESININKDREKKEFLADVSSFANASGGDLIYGIVEDRKKGIPKELKGLNIENVDQEILRLENIIRSGIDPRIPNIETHVVTLNNSYTVLIIRVQKSWIAPHRVSYQGHSKFYTRSSNGKYPMDVSELRIAFNLSETITEKIRKFREDRISNIIANEAPVLLNHKTNIILHLIPIVSFNPAQSYDIAKIASPELRVKMAPINCSGMDGRYNFDGYINYCALSDDVISSYVQLFKNGIIEAVEGFLLRPKSERLLIPIKRFEFEVGKSLSDYLYIQKILGVEPPIFIFLTLIGVKGYSIPVDIRKIGFWNGDSHPIDRDILLLPENYVETYEVKTEVVLRPCFDAVWNACGYPRSLNYNEEGRWGEGNRAWSQR